MNSQEHPPKGLFPGILAAFGTIGGILALVSSVGPTLTSVTFGIGIAGWIWAGAQNPILRSVRIVRRRGNRRSWPVAISVGVLFSGGVPLGVIGVARESLVFFLGAGMIILGALVSEFEVKITGR